LTGLGVGGDPYPGAELALQHGGLVSGEGGRGEEERAEGEECDQGPLHRAILSDAADGDNPPMD
jgi:hypothetical protein